MASDTALSARLNALRRTMATDQVLSLQGRLRPTLETLCRTLALALGCERVMLAVVTGHDDQYPVHVGFGDHLPAHPHRLGPTLCHHVLAEGRTLALADTQAQAPYNAVGSVVHGGVRAYLGTPVHFGGEMVGSLCAIGTHSRPWSTAQCATLEGLARLTEDALEAAWARSTLETEHEESQLRLRELEEGVIARQLAFRDVSLGLGLLKSRLVRLPSSGELSSITALCADLQWQMHETNQGVLASLAIPGARMQAADTSWAELLALSVVAIDSPRVVWVDAPALSMDQNLSLSSVKVPPCAQANALKAVVCVLRECLSQLPLTHELTLHARRLEQHTPRSGPPAEVARLSCQARPVPAEAAAYAEVFDLQVCMPTLQRLLEPHLRSGRLALSWQAGTLHVDFIG